MTEAFYGPPKMILGTRASSTKTFGVCGAASLSSHESRWLIALLLMFMLLATAYNFSNPLGEASDEDSHFGVIRNYRRWGLLQGGRQHESFQPPLYYLIGASLAQPFGLRHARLYRNRDFTTGDSESAPNLFIHTAAEDWPFAPWVWAWHALRLYSTLCVTVALAATWKLAHLACPGEPWVALLATVLIAFAPGVLFIASAVNNDNLALALAALTLWWCARLLQDRSGAPDPLILGMLLGAGFMTKMSLLTLWVPTAFALGYACRQSGKQRWAPLLHRAAWLALGALATGGWWAAYQWWTHDDLLGWSRTLNLNLRREAPLTVTNWIALARGVWESYWLQWLHLRQPAWVYTALTLIPLLGLLGWIRLAHHGRIQTVCSPSVMVMLTLQSLAVVAAWGVWTIHILGTDQARLAFPALPAMVILAASGLTSLWKRAKRFLAMAVTVALLSLSLWTLLGIIRPTYAPPVTEPASTEPPPIVFGGLLGLKYEVLFSRDPLQSGDSILIETRWQALAPMTRDLWLQLKLQPVDGDPVVVDFGTPSAGRYATDRWPVGRIVSARHRMIVPEGVPSGDYRVIASVRPPDEERWLPVAQYGQVIGEEIVLARTRVVNTP